MKLNSRSLLLGAVALMSASGSIAEAVEGSYGCSEDYCWASCSINTEKQPWVYLPDPSRSVEEWADWCWTTSDGSEDYIACEDGCSLDDNDYQCGGECSTDPQT